MLTWFVCSNPGCSPDTAAQRDMKTHWVITVKDPGDRGAGALGYEHRFEFDDTEKAFRCAKGAQELEREPAFRSSARPFASLQSVGSPAFIGQIGLGR